MAERFAFLPADLSGALTPLARAALSHAHALPGVRLPRSAAECESPAGAWDAELRAELSAALLDPLARLEPHGAVLERARALARPQTLCVVAAAHPGLLGGPLASLWQGLACVRLARTIADCLGVEVVPILFNRADERVLAPAHILNCQLDPQRVGLSALDEGRRALGTLVIDEERHRTAALRSALVQLHGGAAHLEQALDLFLPRPGESPARAATRSLLALAGPLGLLVAEPDWLRPQLTAALVRIVGTAPPDALATGADNLGRLDPAAALRAQALPALVHFAPGGARELLPGGEGFRFEGESGSRRGAEVAAAIVGAPTAWAAGARLEHLALDLVLPCVCELGNADALAARAAAAPLRTALGLAPGPFVLRGEVSVVDAACERSLAACSLEVADVLGGSAPPSSAALPPQVVEALRTLGSQAGASLRGLRPELAEIDRGLATRLRRVAGQVENLVGALAERAERVHHNRAGTRRRHLRRANGALRPAGKPQEEVLAPFSLVARHGRGWVEPLAGALASFGAEHLVWHLGTP